MSTQGSSTTLRFRAIYKKVPGTLFVTETFVGWNPDVANAETVRKQQLVRVLSMFTSKAGAAKTSLKIAFLDDIPPGGLHFTFTSPTALEDRQTVQDLLIPHVTRNKADPGSAVSGGAAAGVSTAIAGAGIGHVGATTASRREDAMDVDPTDGQEESTHGSRAAASVIRAINNPNATGNGSIASPSAAEATPSKSSAIIDLDRLPPVPAAKKQSSTNKNNAPEVIALKKAVLNKNPQLKQLHKELVIRRYVTDDDFWMGREHLLEQEALLSAQRPGRSSQLLDDRFGFSSSMPGAANRQAGPQGGTGFGMAKSKTGGGGGAGAVKGAGGADADGELKVKITPELQREVFDEFPIVGRIYAENVGIGVGEEMTETVFWTRYFRSALWERHRASARTTGEASYRRADPVFDSYLEEADDDLEPKNAPGRTVDMFLDLAATEEDHGETGNTADVTMQAGKQRATLPLIRRFNDHSNRLVAQDEDSSSAALILEGEDSENRLYSEIDYEDLRGPEKEQVWELDVADREGAFDGRGLAGGLEEEDETEIWLAAKGEAEVRQVPKVQRDLLATYKPDLPNVIPQRSIPGENGVTGPEKELKDAAWTRHKRCTDEALKGVVAEVLAGGEARLQQEPIPDEIMSQMLTCHSAAIEFLRQFWSAVLPSPLGALNPQTMEQKAVRARKLAGYLALHQGKVDSVVKVARNMKAGDPDRVREALNPTMSAVNRALAHWATIKK